MFSESYASKSGSLYLLDNYSFVWFNQDPLYSLIDGGGAGAARLLLKLNY